ncbi:hypothetical protein QTJ16_000690 [Diplocarpon rosae]|uniref:Uncharacterized protein n=1 Tax=Diplocarpon rosae TaxID=946125 RepID=A0AAD9T7K9_9HELO|nr:hypothetical protein QTJ16_000690 [Diplocarpon rosae]
MSRILAPSAEDEEIMKITHTTYEEAQVELPSVRRQTSMASGKVRGYISRRLSRAPDAPLSTPVPYVEDERPTAMWPQLEEMPADDGLQHTKKAGHQQDYTTYKPIAKPSRNYAPLRSPPSKPPTRQSEPPLPKKAATLSSLVKDKLHRKSFPQSPDSPSASLNEAENERGRGKGQGEAKTRRETDDDQMVKIHTLRKAMHEGKLERVIPPLSTKPPIGTGRGRHAPPRPAQPRFLESASLARIAVPRGEAARTSHSLRLDHERGKGRERGREGEKEGGSRSQGKEKEMGGRIASFIGTSADMLDETRRELQARFRPPFEHLGYPSFSLARKRDAGNAEGDADSDESFFCLGDTGKLKAQLEMTGRAGNEPVGREWVEKCKPGGLGRASRTKELCIEPEDGLRLQERGNGDGNGNFGESEYSSSEYEDEVVVDSSSDDDELKPAPPPLKDWKPLQITKKKPLDPPIDARRPPQVLREKPPASLEEWKPLQIEKQGKVHAPKPRQRNPFKFEDSDTDSDDEHPPPAPPKANHDLIFRPASTKNGLRPNIVDGECDRQVPLRAAVKQSRHAGSETRTEKLRRWEIEGAGDDYAESQKALSRWSSSCGNQAGERDGHWAWKDSGFYQFWDEVLREHGPSIPGSAGMGMKRGQ